MRVTRKNFLSSYHWLFFNNAFNVKGVVLAEIRALLALSKNILSF